MAEVLVCNSESLQEGRVLLWRHDSIEVGLFRRKGKIYCYRNVCPHQGGPACEGVRRSAVEDLFTEEGLFAGQRYNDDDVHIVCPWHGYEFHLDTGRHVGDPNIGLQKFETVERDGAIYVFL